MRDAATVLGSVKTARLMRAIGESEAKQRNALSRTKPGFSLSEGAVVTVVETFDSGSAFLVEFTKDAKAKKDTCDWMGVLYPSEIEVVDIASRA